MENVHSTTRNIYSHWKTSFIELLAIFINSKFVSFCLCWLEGFTHLVCRFFYCIKKITVEVTAGAPSLPMHFDAPSSLPFLLCSRELCCKSWFLINSKWNTGPNQVQINPGLMPDVWRNDWNKSLKILLKSFDENYSDLFKKITQYFSYFDGISYLIGWVNFSRIIRNSW